MPRDYIYKRPPEGHVEDHWFAKLPEAEQRRVEVETKQGIAARRDAWNASQPVKRHIPRVS